MSDRAPYSRVYWSVMDDAKFDGIREDCRLMGAWTILLIVADMAWPAPAFHPPTIPKAAMSKLVEAGLVDSLSGGRFRIHGLHAERGRRSETARESASARWSQSERIPTAMRSHTERNARRDETSQDETSLANGRADAMDTYWTLLGVYPNGRSKEWLQELVNEFDDRRVSAAIAAEAKGDRQGLLSRVRDRLRSDADKAAKAKALAQAQRLEDEAAAKRITPEQAAENKRLIDLELQRMVKR